MKVLVKEPFILNLGVVGGIPKIVPYATGIQDMDPEHFKHWWAQRHNVESLEPAAQEAPTLGQNGHQNKPSPIHKAVGKQ